MIYSSPHFMCQIVPGADNCSCGVIVTVYEFKFETVVLTVGN